MCPDGSAAEPGIGPALAELLDLWGRLDDPDRSELLAHARDLVRRRSQSADPISPTSAVGAATSRTRAGVDDN